MPRRVAFEGALSFLFAGVEYLQPYEQTPAAEVIAATPARSVADEFPLTKLEREVVTGAIKPVVQQGRATVA